MSEKKYGLGPLASKIDFNSSDSIPSPKEGTGIPVVDAANKIEGLIYRDTLTGFENRRGLNRFKNGLTEKDYPLTLLSIDLDNLKKINDNPDPEKGGHTGGDKYILSFVKFVDEIFPDIKKFRIGGDEFTIPLLEDQLGSETIYSKLEDFNNREQNPNKLELTYAYDVAISDKDFYSALKRSDDKLVEAKKEKKIQQNFSNQDSVNEKQQPQ